MKPFQKPVTCTPPITRPCYKVFFNVKMIHTYIYIPGYSSVYLVFLCRHFQATDQKKFHDIWAMNEEQVRELVHSVLEEDRIIHEHQLGLPWEKPDL